MGSLSKSIIHNAGKRDPMVPRAVNFKGERRAERYPSGFCETHVDPQGDVMNNLQLVPPGVPATRDAVTRARAEQLQKGFVPHGQCPLRNGVRYDDRFRDEFDEMPKQLEQRCDEDPKTVTRGKKGVLECGEGCPHIEWLIAFRKDKAAKARLAKRSEKVNLTEVQLAAQQAALDEQKKTNERLLEVVSSLVPRGKKATNE